MKIIVEVIAQSMLVQFERKRAWETSQIRAVEAAKAKATMYQIGFMIAVAVAILLPAAILIVTGAAQ